jgi:hypothetical protein
MSAVHRLRDDHGEWVMAGDWISFSFAIPPILVQAEVYQDGDSLCYRIKSPKDVLPATGNLRSLRRYVHEWRKIDTENLKGGGDLCPKCEGAGTARCADAYTVVCAECNDTGQMRSDEQGECPYCKIC